MEIKGKVHCFFEQSGTFKNEFIKLGIPAEDYDIQNNFGETDHTDDLFKAIEDAYDGKPSLFDNIRGGQDGDLIMAFFPCIYFSCLSQLGFTYAYINYRKMSQHEKTEVILKRSRDREMFYELIIKMFSVALERGIRMIVENPYSENHYLKSNFVLPPTLVDQNRMLRGDYFVKPTAYWFLNCEPTHGFTKQCDKEKKQINKCRKGKEAGICSEERSMISSDYARNFICDFILGRPQPEMCPTLFDAM